MNSWVVALSIFNYGQENWVIPRKFTHDYDTVTSIMATLKSDKALMELGVRYCVLHSKNNTLSEWLLAQNGSLFVP
tara:strand:+ start:3148 stop:3375 length:228 start_codon:yes stop_codon:yes gene_type:complete